jgi:hypothetical protein
LGALPELVRPNYIAKWLAEGEASWVVGVVTTRLDAPANLVEFVHEPIAGLAVPL